MPGDARSARVVFAILGGSVVVAGGILVGRFAVSYQPEALHADNAAGDSACISCHTEQARFEATAHHLTSRLPARDAIAGSFTPGANVLRTSNPALHFRMDSTAAGFYETAVMGRPPDTTTRSERIDVVTGSRKGQSYLYWGDGGRLYQLPVSYWDGIGWTNSPGYPDGQPNFGRPIPPRCLECHASWFAAVSDPTASNRYRRDRAILGVSCETCHGAGRAHVSRERSVLHAVLPADIVNPARLPRVRQLDVCALCHSGTAPLRSIAFAHVPGQRVERVTSLSLPLDSGSVDVHGNQVALLQRSRCFRASQMTCTTCHDVHQSQRDLAAFSGRCLTCHTPQSCGLFPKHGQTLVGRCVDCHMPTLTSSVIFSNYQGKRLVVQVRTHWIKVYPKLQ
jgi:cytochrome c554/c'-like protein